MKTLILGVLAAATLALPAQAAGPATFVQAGRVLVDPASGKVETARACAYAAIDRIDWPGGFHRRDIGWRAIGR